MIYENVKKLCDEIGISINALEKKTGLANGTIGGWRHKTPKIYTLMKVAKGLDVPLDKLIEGVDVTIKERQDKGA